MEPCCLSKLEKNSAKDFGGKGNGLAKLLDASYSIPLTYALSLSRWNELGHSKARVLDSLDIDSLPLPLMVRSSASIEDQEMFSFAGTFQSIVVKKREQIKDAVSKVMDSITGSQNRELFESLGINPDSVFPGFVIQPYFETKRQGVGFSRNPTQLWDLNACIEVSLDPHGSVVDGEHDTKLISQQSNRDPFYQKLFSALRDLENRFQTPVDLEWGETVEGELVFFQLRPISGPVAKSVRQHLKNPQTVWSRELAAERFPDCLTPMGFDVVADGLPTNLKALFDYFGIKTGDASGLVYSDEGWVYHSDRFFKYPGGVKISFFQFLKRRPFFVFRLKFALLLFMGRWILRSSLARPLLGAKLSEALIDPIQSKTKMDFDLGRLKILELRSELDHFLTWPASKAEISVRMRRVNEVAQVFLKTDFIIFIAKEALFKSYEKIWSLEKHRNGFLDQISQLKKNISFTQLTHAEDLTYARTSWDVYLPSVSGQIKSLGLEHKSKTTLAIEEVDSVWKLRIEKLQQWMEWDEELHHYTGVLIEGSRRILLSAGDWMVNENILTHRELVFFLTLNEVKAYLSGALEALTPRALYRKKRFEVRKQNQPSISLPPQLNDNVQDRTPSKNSGANQGIGMSNGKAVGKFLYLSHYSDLTQLPVEPFILVTQSPNPAWIPLFPKMLGWITETGGPLAHGFVAARDYGIPAVSKVNISELLNRAQDKALKLDGTAGIIEVQP